jgi:hypothetical protein
MRLANRRDFLKTLTAAAAVSAPNLSSHTEISIGTEGRPPATDCCFNREPLSKSSCYPLPLTSIQTKGWLFVPYGAVKPRITAFPEFAGLSGSSGK